MKLIDLTGKIFGRLVVLNKTISKGRKARWRCRCSCGNITTTNSQNLREGIAQSCGCLQKELISERMQNRSIDNRTKHPLFRIWVGILYRC